MQLLLSPIVLRLVLVLTVLGFSGAVACEVHTHSTRSSSPHRVESRGHHQKHRKQRGHQKHRKHQKHRGQRKHRGR